MRRIRGIILVGTAAAACATADPVDARSKACGSDAALPAALADRYAVLRAPARRSDALPAGADCRLGNLTPFRRGVRLLARHKGGARSYFMPVFERQAASGFSGLSACVVTLTPATLRKRVRGRTRTIRYFDDVGGCSATPTRADALPVNSWFNAGRRTVAAIPDGIARVRLRLEGESADREVAVRRNAVVIDGALPLSWTWLAADGSVVTSENAPFVCEE